MWRKWLTLLSIVCLCAGECVDNRPQQFATVEVYPHMIVGQLQDAFIDLIEVGSRKSFRSNFRGSTALRIPYGEYILRVQAPGFKHVERNLRVLQPVVTVRTMSRVASECFEHPSIEGTIQSIPDVSRLWVKAVTLHGVEGGEAPVRSGGQFLIAGLDIDRYVLLVLDGAKVLHTRVVEASLDRKIVIDLAR